MLYRPLPLLLARMPSTRSQPLNPRVAGTPAQAPVMSKLPPVRPGPPNSPSRAPDPVRHDDDEDDSDTLDKARRAGGFHESSFDLKNGLEVSESDWPPDTTIPGALDESTR
jgi:hypothetical protein